MVDYDMGTPNRESGEPDVPREGKTEGLVNLAFVLLSEARVPDAEWVALAFRRFAGPGEELQREVDDSAADAGDRVLSFELNSGGRFLVALMPAAVPNSEAEDAARYSLSSFRNQWKLPPHCAHLIVTFLAATESPPMVRLSQFTSFVAAVTKASRAVGVYWGNAGATHDSDFFLSIASEQDIPARMMLWSGVSIARDNDGRLSLLSLGMKQLNLPDLLLVAGNTSPNTALGMMFDLLTYVANRGAAIPEGETVGRSADEKLKVRYVPSPIDDTTKVWRVELP
jgi:hypothetical protein